MSVGGIVPYHCDTNDGALFLPLRLADPVLVWCCCSQHMWLQQHLYTEHLPAAPALNFRGAARLRPLAGDWPPVCLS
ncbi:unnamed protein product [Staurois parvus]|uniref:JmjC domain-containing protein n=1 Tax=Staurois parvus TaxID=386267 RepID=A0ABN9CJB7_9NEOB|nr:unnamed protein product [Staurois parvus]